MSPATSAPPPPFRLIRAAQVLDGDGGALPHAAVLVEGDTIRALGPQSEVRAPDGAACETLEFPDATLLPGLIDTHTHLNGFGDGRPGDDLARLPDSLLLLQAARNARTHLASGVTTLRDCGTKGDTGFALRDAARQGIVPAPRLVLCGRPITITGGHLWYFGEEADGEDGVRLAVRRIVKAGADHIKLIATGGSTRTSVAMRPAFSVAELRAAVDEAHKLGRPAAAHCSSTQGVINAVDAGVDTVIHCRFIEPDGSVRYRPDVAERIAAAGCWVDATIAQARFRLQQLEALQAQGALDPRGQQELERGQRAQQTLEEHFRDLLAAGVKMVSGSDSSWMWYPMGHFQEEVIGHSEWGMGPSAAIVSATGDAARCLGIDAVTGTLAPGKQADLLVVDGDPFTGITALRHVRAVFQAGVHVSC